jgi:predicted ATP-dependent endonuclease of OLD family
VHITSFRVENFRRLKDVRIDLDRETSTFVGANNSGKTSATHVFQLFLGKARAAFQIYDFTADCWAQFNSFDPRTGNPDRDLPRITLDLWLDVDDANAHRVVDLLPNLDWSGEPVGVRLEYAPRHGELMLQRFAEARADISPPEGQPPASWKPWPQSMTDYLTRRLRAEYEIRYSVLDHGSCGTDLKPAAGYEPYPLGTVESGAAKLVESLIRIDFLNAQRYLSDTESHGRDEELSKRLSRFYTRNLDKREADIEALSAVADSEARLNAHFASVFKPTLDRLTQLGYPGISNPGLVVKASLDAGSILNGSARVHYALPASAGGGAAGGTDIVTLPDQYNGLGFKNLIYMVVEVLDFHHAWIDEPGEHPPIHMVMIEEPEAHLHAQLQQVFIRKIREILPPMPPEFVTQMVVTTHSPHVIYERTFEHIRYFKRGGKDGEIRHSEVRNLSGFSGDEEAATRKFLLQYLKLTHCDLFFADAAVLVEGNAERLLLPLIIQKEAPELRACHLTILEVGGAFAHKFQKLIEFLGLPTLVITDLDSVHAKETPAEEDADDDAEKDRPQSACMTTEEGAVTSNKALRHWLPKRRSIQELLFLDDAEKCPPARDGEPGHTRLAYETLEPAAWRNSSEKLAGRTFEEAFALQNLDWCQAPEQKELGLNIRRADELDLAALHEKIYERVKTFDKTKFALGLIGADTDSWSAPQYIIDGLTWLSGVLLVEPGPAVEAALKDAAEAPAGPEVTG